eukprot:1328736-Pyramimonas_sp.AAC.1
MGPLRRLPRGGARRRVRAAPPAQGSGRLWGEDRDPGRQYVTRPCRREGPRGIAAAAQRPLGDLRAPPGLQAP